MHSKFSLKNLIKLNKRSLFSNFYQKYLIFSKKEIIFKLIFFIIFAIPFIIDKVLKSLIYNNLKEGDFKNIISKLFSFNYKKNSGIAGGFLSNNNLLELIIGITFVILVMLFLIFLTSKNTTISIGCLLVFVGGLDNLSDRLSYKCVVDYIVLVNSNFSCNIGDGLIFGGIFALLGWSFCYFFVPEVKKINVEPTKIL
ncbi:signal peptidase II [symbiont of Argiope bruennichi]|uniref:signal peptidase II n=1 Tax=symbiont of Argiope bruennichi TaxID=2810479 RepID=UPI003DA26D01